jgi:hypothetical protein
MRRAVDVDDVWRFLRLTVAALSLNLSLPQPQRLPLASQTLLGRVLPR